jgi:hypothetical protein
MSKLVQQSDSLVKSVGRGGDKARSGREVSRRGLGKKRERPREEPAEAQYAVSTASEGEKDR